MVTNDLEIDFGTLLEITGLVQTVDAVTALNHVVALVVEIPLTFKQVGGADNGVNRFGPGAIQQALFSAVYYRNLHNNKLYISYLQHS